MDQMRLQEGKGTMSRMGGIHRRFQRETVIGFSGDIADGNHMIAGDVDNVSTNGFKMINITGSFRAGKHYYQTIISGDGKYYKLMAKPCWKRKTVGDTEIGFKIVDAPWEWFEFILESVPEKKGGYVPNGLA